MAELLAGGAADGAARERASRRGVRLRPRAAAHTCGAGRPHPRGEGAGASEAAVACCKRRDSVLITEGITDSDEVIISRIPTPVPEMKLRTPVAL